MAQTEMHVELLAHTQLTKRIRNSIYGYGFDTFGTFGLKDYPDNELEDWKVKDGQVVALAAIRTCYSHNSPLGVLATESEKYFGDKGKEGKRLFNHIVKSGHTSTLEHINFTFAVDGVSRSLLAQLTRHRHMSFSVQSQRYVKQATDSRHGGFDYVIPQKVLDGEIQLLNGFLTQMREIQESYDWLIENGVPQEDARAVLPNAAATNLVLTVNLRTLLEFYSKRKSGNGAQHEITILAEKLKDAVVEVEPWTVGFFETS